MLAAPARIKKFGGCHPIHFFPAYPGSGHRGNTLSIHFGQLVEENLKALPGQSRNKVPPMCFWFFLQVLLVLFQLFVKKNNKKLFNLCFLSWFLY